MIPTNDYPFHVQKLLENHRRRIDGRLADFSGERIGTLGIVGAGLMGQAIARAALAQGIEVVLNDVDSARVETVRRELAQRFESSLVRVTADPTVLGEADLVLESVIESINIKRKVYRWLEPHLGPGTILATNTSTIPVGRLASELDCAERFCGVHFFHPVARRPLVEVIPGDRTSRDTLGRVVGLVRTIEKYPLWVGDWPGFVVNRLLHPYLTEAMALLLEGVAPERIDRVAVAAGMDKGPLRLADEIGLDTVLDGGRVLLEAYGARIQPSPLLIGLYKSGQLGVKSGAGFYRYPQGAETTAPTLDPTTAERIAFWRREVKTYSDEAICARLWLGMLLEGVRLLDEAVVGSPEEIDLAVLFGLGFPLAIGGLFAWAASIGWEGIIARAEVAGQEKAVFEMEESLKRYL